MKNRRFWWMAGAMLAGLAPCVQAAEIDEIVVSARKVEENLQSVPISVTALSREDLERANVITMQDVAQLTPGLTFQDLGSGTYQLPTIRGLAQTNIFAAENNVGVFIDGIYLSNKSGVDIQMLDVERIEVIKGPQSALFGQNSFAGAINYVTARPADDLSAEASFSVGTDSWLEARGNISGAIADGWTARLSLAGRSFDGSIDNTYNSSDKVQGFDDTAVSLSVDGGVGEILDVRLFAYRGEEQREQGGEVLLANNCGAGPTGAPTYYCGDLPAFDSVDLTPGGYGLDRQTTLGALTLDWQLTPRLSLISVSSYVENETTSYPDVDFTGGGVPFALAGGGVLTTNSWLSPGDPSSEDLSQELRLVYQGERLRLLGGVYYFDGEERSVTAGGVDITNLPAGDALANPIAGLLATTDPFAQPRPILDSILSTETRALFGLVSYQFTDALAASVEVRYAKDERSIDRPLVFFAPGASQSGDFSYVTPRFTLDFTASDDLLLYTSAAKGARSGGFNRLFSPLFPDEATFGEEINWTYEIGMKSAWLDERLRLNAAVFYVDWEDLQIQSRSQDSNSFAQPVRNVKGATSRGLELELNASLGEAVTLGMGYAYADPEFKSGTVDIGMASACGVDNSICRFASPGLPDVSGNQLGRTHKHQVNANLTWNGSLSGAWDYYLRTDGFYLSEQPSRSINQQFVESRFLVNARLGLQRGNAEFALWAINLLDEEYVVSQNRQPRFPTSATLTNTIQGQERIVGVTATYRFRGD